MSTNTPGWYADPEGVHEYRYWDGAVWTQNVSNHGRESITPLKGTAKNVTGSQNSEKIQAQVQKHSAQSEKRGAPSAPLSNSGSGLLDQSVLVVNQKTKLIEVNTEFAIHDAQGNQVGSVRQVGQNKFKKAARFLGSFDQYFTHKFQVVDTQGVPQLLLTRPAKFFKSRVIVSTPQGQEIGQIKQSNMIGKIRFDLECNGQSIGRIQGENWRAWNFAIYDATEREVARITKTFEGVLKTMFTAADNYVLQIHHPLTDPLRLMTYASAIAVDVALKQDHRGFSPLGIADSFG